MQGPFEAATIAYERRLLTSYKGSTLRVCGSSDVSDQCYFGSSVFLLESSLRNLRTHSCSGMATPNSGTRYSVLRRKRVWNDTSAEAG
jgi:hypothetical protein